MRNRALNYLRHALNSKSAEFRDGQWEAITRIVSERERLLVVQRTGWGKSMIYFVATRLQRDLGRGPTLLISPLLSLMRNQMLAADRLGLKAVTINSSNTDDWQGIHDLLIENKADLLMISPERLSNELFRSEVLPTIAPTVGMLVIDEAHCISDWGHDFRPDYKRIVRLLRVLPTNVPVLAVTATANNRVVEDVAQQIGQPAIQRGTLLRESLRLQSIVLPNQAQRLAWLADVLPTIDGCGVVYTLTVRDAELVASWLTSRGLNVRAYHSELENETKVELENKLLANEVKALVATTALGMGFDKPDLSFVVHFQRPASVIHYYQQVGRAGRALPNAYGVLLSGEEDDEIAEYFQRTALPPVEHIAQVTQFLESCDDGASTVEIERNLNLSRGQIEKVLKALSLEDPAPIVKIDRAWRRTPVSYIPNGKFAEDLRSIRLREQERMQQYVLSTACAMNFLQAELDDLPTAPCGKCAMCDPTHALPTMPSDMTVREALRFLRQSEESLEPRKQWPSDALAEHKWKGKIPEHLRAEVGRTLCRWGDAGWGGLVRGGKLHAHSYDDKLVQAARELICDKWGIAGTIKWVTCVPSTNHARLVPDFAARLAVALNLPFKECIQKTRDTRPQKEMQNSYQQARNLAGAFAISDKNILHDPVLLVDDMVDSGWTFTITAALLREAGSGPVYPFALAKVISS